MSKSLGNVIDPHIIINGGKVVTLSSSVASMYCVLGGSFINSCNFAPLCFSIGHLWCAYFLHRSISLSLTCLSRIHSLCPGDHPFPIIFTVMYCILTMFMSNSIVKTWLFRSVFPFLKSSFYTPRKLCCGGYTVYTSVRPSVTLCFLNILKSHGWIFIKPCKHVHICKTNTLNKKVRARDQFY